MTVRQPSKRVLKALEVYERTGKIDQVLEALTMRQRLFAEAFVLSFNGTDAAIKAGYAPKDAVKQAHLVKTNPGVAAYIAHLSTVKSEKTIAVDTDFIIAELVTLLSKDGARDADKIRILEILARHKGMFIDRTEITGRDGEAIRIEQQKIAEEAHHFMNQIAQMAKKNKKEVTIP